MSNIDFSSLTDNEITKQLYGKYKGTIFFTITLVVICIVIYYGRNYYFRQKYRRLYSENNLVLYSKMPKEILTSNIIIDASKFAMPSSQHCFTYSMFLNVKDWYINYGKYKHVFHRGSDVIEDYSQKCRSSLSWNQIPEQYPGIWFDDKTNDMWVTMSTRIKEVVNNDDKCTKNKQNKYKYVPAIEYSKLENIPVSYYFCLTAVFDKEKIELYINGKLKQTTLLKGTPHQNIENGYIGIGNSFAGYMSDFRYVPYSLMPEEVHYLYKLHEYKYK